MDEITLVVSLVFVGLFSALVTAYIAHMYNRSLALWLLIGFLLPFLGIFIAIAFAMYDAHKAEAADETEPQ
jgi:cbb3-type cytochrome oxidase subunit 3